MKRKMEINPDVNLSEEDWSRLQFLQCFCPRYKLAGLADLHSGGIVPIWKKHRKAESKYIPHQGARECARRRKQLMK